MVHPLPTNLEDCNGLLYCLADWAYDVTNGFFWMFVALAFAITLYLATLRYGTTRAFAYGSFGGATTALILVILNLMSWWIASAFIIVGGIGFVALIISDK